MAPLESIAGLPAVGGVEHLDPVADRRVDHRPQGKPRLLCGRRPQTRRWRRPNPSGSTPSGVIGVDEHRWAPRRRGAAGFVTLIIDLTPIPIAAARRACLTWCPVVHRPRWRRGRPLNPPAFARAVEVIAVDGFAGYKTAATDVIPDAVTVMDPFHVVALAGAKLDLIRQRVQAADLVRRGHTGDPLYGILRIARTRIQLLSARRYARLTAVFDTDEHPRGQSRLADLPAQHRRLQPARSPPRQDHDDEDHRPATPWCAHRARGIVADPR